MGRRNEEKPRNLTLRITAEVRQLLDDEAERESLSLSQLVDRKLRVAYGLAEAGPEDVQEELTTLKSQIADIERRLAALEAKKK